MDGDFEVKQFEPKPTPKKKFKVPENLTGALTQAVREIGRAHV